MPNMSHQHQHQHLQIEEECKTTSIYNHPTKFRYIQIETSRSNQVDYQQHASFIRWSRIIAVLSYRQRNAATGFGIRLLQGPATKPPWSFADSNRRPRLVMLTTGQRQSCDIK